MANPKIHNSNQWTDARFHGFKMALIRDGLRRWNPKHKCVQNAECGEVFRAKTKRKCKTYQCTHCGGVFTADQMKADHIEPMVPLTGFVSWDDTMERAFVEVDGFQAVCGVCHQIKSNEEKELRMKYKT